MADSLTPPDIGPLDPLERLPEEWEARMVELGEPRYRGRQVFRWIHHRNVLDPHAMSDLPKSLRGKLEGEGLGWPVSIAHAHLSDDGTKKIVGRLDDAKEVETVLIPQLRALDPDVDEDESEVIPGKVNGRRITQCISSQVGCAMGCVFCASGIAGLKRHLRASEIVGQVLLGRREVGEDAIVRNVVFMGMGEPLHNYEAVARALRLLTHPDGMNLSHRRVTVSTSGLVPQIDRLAKDFGGRVALAISLHNVDDAKRSEIMPINRKHPLPELVDCLRRYPLAPRKRITIEYTLIRGVNDSLEEADALSRLLRGVRFKVNLIPMNPVKDSPLGAPDWATVERFQARLRERSVACYVRVQRGDDIAAACGQLALHGEKRRIKMRLPTVAGSNEPRS